MLGSIMKILPAVKSVGDIISGKADAQDYLKVTDVATDIIGTFVPAAAPLLDFIDNNAEGLIRAVTSMDPAKGEQLKADIESFRAVRDKLVSDIEASRAAIMRMSDKEIDSYIDLNGGYRD